MWSSHIANNVVSGNVLIYADSPIFIDATEVTTNTNAFKQSFENLLLYSNN